MKWFKHFHYKDETVRLDWNCDQTTCSIQKPHFKCKPVKIKAEGLHYYQERNIQD